MRLLIVGFLLIASVGCAVGETTTIYDAESAVFRTLFTRDLQSTPSSPVTRARRTAGPGDSCTVPTQDKDCTHEYLCVNGTCTTCLGDDQCDSLEQCSSGKCLHKGFFSPFTWHEALGTIISFVGASLAAGGGLGGGGLFVPILVLIVGLAPTSAVAISQGMIFGGSIVNLIFNIRRKHPISKHRPLIDFDAVLMLEPALLAGTVIGVLLNSIFPEWLIVSLLAITLVIMTWRTVQKARQVWAIESQQRVGAGRNVMELEDVSTDQTDLAGGDDEEVAAFLDAEEKSPATSPSSGRRDKTDSLRVKAARRAQAGPRSITDDDDDDTDLELSKASSENGEAGGGGGAGSISAANMALIEAIKKRPRFIMVNWSALITYDTGKVVQVKSKTVGIINRTVQIFVLIYIIVYVIVIKKGYQATDSLIGTSITKVKGTAFTCPGHTQLENCEPGTVTIWDTADYVIPPQENDATFVQTNSILTPYQKQGTCAQATSSGTCDDATNPCTAYEHTSSGIQTGKCIPNGDRGNTTCEVWSWCPLEADGDPGIYRELTSAANFTLFLKSNIRFPKLMAPTERAFTNVGLGNSSAAYLKSCRWDTGSNYYCPIFVLETIIERTGWKFSDLTRLGGVVAIIITWNCDLDKGYDDCLPTFRFSRLDDPESVLSPGYNFRYANFYQTENFTNYRSLQKAYGVRFVIIQTGIAGKFSIVPMFLNIGAGLALLGLATVVADFLSLNCLKHKRFYRSKKYESVDDAELDMTIQVDQTPLVKQETYALMKDE